MGCLDRAIGYYEQSLAISREPGHRVGIANANAYSNWGIIYQTRGDLKHAIEYYEQALAINVELGCKEGMADNYTNLGGVYQTCGDSDRAVEYWNDPWVYCNNWVLKTEWLRFNPGLMQSSKKIPIN
ncbi:MAG: tetratricopeptide repeat protein [Nitrosomonas sp.]|uniref:tetratricopeptide repeat protein n=1 Tax=Nitrosomonas sp. TaxID=42353 RepID=UPI0032ED9BA4